MATARLTAKRIEGKKLFVTATFDGAPVPSKEYEFNSLFSRQDVLDAVAEDLRGFSVTTPAAKLEKLSAELEHDIVNGTVIDENGPVAPPAA